MITPIVFPQSSIAEIGEGFTLCLLDRVHRDLLPAKDAKEHTRVESEHNSILTFGPEHLPPDFKARVVTPTLWQWPWLVHVSCDAILPSSSRADLVTFAPDPVETHRKAACRLCGLIW
jgi:hypothetical protein